MRASVRRRAGEAAGHEEGSKTKRMMVSGDMQVLESCDISMLDATDLGVYLGPSTRLEHLSVKAYGINCAVYSMGTLMVINLRTRVISLFDFAS
jgi:hypothetical protein